MSTKHQICLIAMAFMAGILGGALSQRLWSAPALAAKPAAPPKLLRAQRFELVDAKGTVYADLRHDENGTGLFFFDGKGFSRVGLVHNKQTAGLVVFDKNKKVRVGVSLDEDAPSVRLYDGKGAPRALLEYGAAGARVSVRDAKSGGVSLGMGDDGAWMMLFDAGGRARAGLSLQQDRTAMHFADEKGNARALIEYASDTTRVALLDSKSAVRTTLMLDPAGPQLFMMNAEGAPQALFSATEQGPQIRLGDKRGVLRAVFSHTDAPEPDKDDDKTENKAPKQEDITQLLLLDKNGVPRVQFNSEQAELRDTAGLTLWAMPEKVGTQDNAVAAPTPFLGLETPGLQIGP